MKNNYPYLFSRLTINNILFRNRIFSAPTSCTPDAGDSTRSPDVKQLMFFEDKARGGAAAVTLNETSISLNSTKKLNTGCIAVMPEEHSAFVNYVKQADIIARHGAVPSIELQHAGYFVHPKCADGGVPVGPSDFTTASGIRCRGMTETQMDEIVRQFADAAKTMKEAGFRMIMLHGGHGWLLAQFLSPATNFRTDEYGGCLENRARFPLRVIRAVREAVGSDFVLEYRISGDEHIENGTTLEDVIEFTKMAKPYIDIIHVSSGSIAGSNQYTFAGIFLPRGLNLHLARAVKKAIPDIYVATVGGYNDPAEMNRIICDGDADIIYVGRQLMADPDTPNKWMTGRDDEVIPCTRCLNCIGNFHRGVKGCDVNPHTGMNIYDLNLLFLKSQQRRVVIVGGGPGGLSAALELNMRGHEVILLEKTDRLGGTLNYIEHDFYKQDLIAYRDRMIHLVGKHKVDVRLNTEATINLLNELNPDAVFCAIGADPSVPPIPGLAENAHTMRQIREQQLELKGNIVILGGGLTGCETGLSFAAGGQHVTIVEKAHECASQANHLHRPAILKAMNGLSDRICCLVNTKCVEVTTRGVMVEDSSGMRFLNADFIINALGQTPKHALVEELSKCDAPIFEAFGDCVTLGQVRGAVHNGYYRAIDVK